MISFDWMFPFKFKCLTYLTNGRLFHFFFEFVISDGSVPTDSGCPRPSEWTLSLEPQLPG